MIVDTSALIAILRDEAEADAFTQALDSESQPKMSVVSYVEAGVATDSARDARVSRRLDDLIRVSEIEIEIVPVTLEQGQMAREAYRDFGKGSGHPARLNFGDCFSYALAREAREPLLFKGADFPATDVEVAL